MVQSTQWTSDKSDYSQDSSEANTIKERPRPNSIGGDESEEDPPERKPSKLKRRQVAYYLSPRCGSINICVHEGVALNTCYIAVLLIL